MSEAGPAGNTATLNLILGVFLKLLGFFVVMYGFNEIDPIKAHQAEVSIQQRFNISVHLAPVTSGLDKKNPAPFQTTGRAYAAIETELKTQVDFLSTEYEASSDTLILRVPAGVILSLNDKPASSPEFAYHLMHTLEVQHDKNSRYALEMIVSGKEDDILIRAISLFVQKMISEGYSRDLMTIGYKSAAEEATVEFRIKQVHA